MPILNNELHRAVLRALKVNELSAVDAAAQGKDAHMAIMKRSTSEPTGEGKPMSDELKAVQAEVEKLTKSVGGLTEQLAQAKAYGELTDAQKAHYNEQDDAGKAAFLAKSADERASIVKAAEPAPKPTVLYKSVDGVEYTNAESAELAKRLDRQHFEKRAGDELGHMKGTLQVRADLLKAAESLGEDHVAALKGADAAFASFMKAHGHAGDTDDDASAGSKLAKAAESVQKRDGVSFAKAYATAAEENPELAAAAVEEG